MLALVSMMLIHGAILASPALIRQIPSDRSLKEALATWKGICREALKFDSLRLTLFRILLPAHYVSIRSLICAIYYQNRILTLGTTT